MSRSDSPGRSVLALFLVLGLIYLVMSLSSRLYYEPLCKNYAESERLIYEGYSIAWAKQRMPGECFFSDRNKNSKRVEVSDIEHTSADWVRWVLSWIATIGGLGGSVWLASVVGGFDVKKKSRKRKSR